MADEMDDAGLHEGLGEGRIDRLGKALQTVDDRDQDVLDTAVPEGSTRRNRSATTSARPTSGSARAPARVIDLVAGNQAGLKEAHFRHLPEGVLDFIGVNFYTTARLRLSLLAPFRGGDAMELLMHHASGARSDLGWPIDPDAFARALRRTARHGLPLLVTENGLADADDTRRERYLRDHLRVVAAHVAAGGDVRGYLHWSLMDNWEWLEGYSARFGLIAVDRTTLIRTPRPSAFAYRDIIRRHEGRLPPDVSRL